MPLSLRFDSAEALTRLHTPVPRDLQRLTRVPQAPSILRRLLHDRDLAWLTLSLVLFASLAGALALS
jgi:hypothetical protein